LADTAAGSANPTAMINVISDVLTAAAPLVHRHRAQEL
jgi:hypothetical protein